MSSLRFFTKTDYRIALRVGVVLLAMVGLLAGLLATRMPVIATDQAQDEITLLCGDQCVHQTLTFETGDQSIDRIDVVFLLDVSGSMGDELSTVTDNAQEIMNTLRALVPDSAFGVASFVDYNGFVDPVYGDTYGSEDDYAYRLDQDITETTGDVADALDVITLEYGEDFPEAYNRALWEMLFLNWRDDSKRIVILFGDAIPHERDFFSENYGIDPGPDEVGGTSDDLYLEDIVEELIDDRIAVIGVNSSSDSDVVTFFRYISEETGGLYFELDEADEIPSAVAELVEEEIATIDRLTVRVPEEYESWVTATPAEYTDVGPHTEGTFEVDICPVEGEATDGLYEFELVVDADGVALDTVAVSIDYTVRCANTPDLFMADHPNDDSSVCSNRFGDPFWMSDYLVVRNREDGVHVHQNPQYGQTNYIYARVDNMGDAPATDARVTLYWGDAAAGLWWPDDWHWIASTTLDEISPEGEVWTEGIPFDPPGAGHYCLLAQVESDEDPIRHEGDVPCDNNIAQRNLHVLDLEPGQTLSATDVSFIVRRPTTGVTGQIDLVVILPDVPPGTQVWIIMPTHLFNLWQEGGGDLDGGRVDGDRILADPGAGETVIYDVPLPPGEEREIMLHVEAPTTEDDPFSMTVVQRVDGQDVGGSTYYYAPPEPGLLGFLPRDLQGWAIPGVVLLLCCGGISVVLVVVGLVLLRRKQRSRGTSSVG